jgi:hypothetical protein
MLVGVYWPNLIRAVRDGGQASELHLGAVLDDVLRLLHELGGFDDASRQFQRDLGEGKDPVTLRHRKRDGAGVGPPAAHGPGRRD